MEEELVVSNKGDDTVGVISMNKGVKEGPIHGVHSLVVGFENRGLEALGGGKSMVVNGGERKVGISRAHMGEMEFRSDQWRVQTRFLGMGRGNVQKEMQLNGLNGQDSYGSGLTNAQAQKYLNTPLSGLSVNIEFNGMGQAHVNELVVQKGSSDQSREMWNFNGDPFSALNVASLAMGKMSILKFLGLRSKWLKIIRYKLRRMKRMVSNLLHEKGKERIGVAMEPSTKGTEVEYGMEIDCEHFAEKTDVESDVVSMAGFLKVGTENSKNEMVQDQVGEIRVFLREKPIGLCALLETRMASPKGALRLFWSVWRIFELCADYWRWRILSKASMMYTWNGKPLMDFKPLGQRIWSMDSVGVPMFSVSKKLKALKPCLQALNRKQVHLNQKVSVLRHEVEQI
ncbi:hypothetical protein Pint_15903 [Pistacia integerrima]|uniref:Uncharacterized protein n=1 Tax=Pistacia integerrima TaxID=434235 RepID=A0ACC0ZB91_9ROSI|nr:hypothetical protein Pint_15903 [Pistacia integerrima]